MLVKYFILLYVASMTTFHKWIDIKCCYNSARERNNAAFELVNLSVADDNSKFLIVQEGGYAHVHRSYVIYVVLAVYR